MLNIDFINTGEDDFDGDDFKSPKDLVKWIDLIQLLTRSVYTYQIPHHKLKEILTSSTGLWKVYAFSKIVEVKGKTALSTQSIVIYRLIDSDKGYKIYNLYQIGVLFPQTDSDEDIDKSIEILKDTIITSMNELKNSANKRIIFYENIRESNVLYRVYHEMENDADDEKLVIKIVENGTYKDGETKILILMRFKGKKKFKIFDELETAGDFSQLLKTSSKSTASGWSPYSKMVAKPIFENEDYKIYESVPYNSLSKIVELHNAHMVKQRDEDYFRKLITRKKGVFLVVKDNEGEIVGYVITRPEYSPLLKKSGGLYNAMNFVGIVVSPKMRGKGVAQKLISLMEEKINEMNQFEYIFGHVRFSNKSAQKLYRKMGYSLMPIGRYKDTKEIKYRLFKRLKRPDIGRHLSEFRKELILGIVLVIGHEFIHRIRDYEGKI